MIQKPFLFQKFWSQFFFRMKIFFSATTSPRMHKKANNDVFTLKFAPIKDCLRASFQTIFVFPKTVFSSNSDALIKSWFKFWRYAEYQLKNWQHVNSLIQKLTRCKSSESKNDELFKVGLESFMFWKSWFKVWRVVRNLFQNLILFESLLSETVYYPFFLHIMVFEKAHTWRNCRFCGVKGSKKDIRQANHSS